MIDYVLLARSIMNLTLLIHQQSGRHWLQLACHHIVSSFFKVNIAIKISDVIEVRIKVT